MKKFTINLAIIAAMALAGVSITSCGKKAAPEDQVRDYGKYFLEKLSANQIDSLKASYPDIVKADSLVSLQDEALGIDSIMVAPIATAGQYEVQIGKGVSLIVNYADDGTITVAQSKGLFAFPQSKMELARKTGLWEVSLGDAELADRLNDKDFFDWLAKEKTVKTSDILTLGRTEGDGYWTDGFRYIVNQTDQHINGSDYKVVYKYGYSVFNGYDYDTSQGTEYKSGKDIPPHGSVKFPFVKTSHGGEDITGVKLNLSQDEIQERFAPYTGTEYNDYLKSKE